METQTYQAIATDVTHHVVRFAFAGSIQDADGKATHVEAEVLAEKIGAVEGFELVEIAEVTTRTIRPVCEDQYEELLQLAGAIDLHIVADIVAVEAA